MSCSSPSRTETCRNASVSVHRQSGGTIPKLVLRIQNQTREQIVEAPTVLHSEQLVEVPKILTAEANLQVPRVDIQMVEVPEVVDGSTHAGSRPAVLEQGRYPGPPTIVILSCQRRTVVLQLFCGYASHSAELRTRRHLCNHRCRWSRQCSKPWMFSSLQLINKVADISVVAQRQIPMVHTIRKTVEQVSVVCRTLVHAPWAVGQEQVAVATCHSCSCAASFTDHPRLCGGGLSSSTLVSVVRVLASRFFTL